MSLAREHGGTIEAEALPAGGSAFTLYLPAASGAMPDRQTLLEPGVTATENSAENSELKGRCVLVLDDEESICMLLEEGLTARGLQVRCTGSPDEALGLLRGQQFDVLICDMNLSVGGAPVNGADVAQRLLEAAKAPKPALILMTGDYMEDSQLGVDDSRRLQKPFRISEVLGLLKRVLTQDQEART